MCHLPIDKFDELEDRIKLFETEYIIAHEEGKNSHFHFMVKITDQEYHNFCQDYFKKKYQLRGRAIKDKPRQYGKERNIKDLSRSMMYTLKDGNYRTNMDEDYIQKLYEESFKKDEKEKDKEKLFKHLECIKFTKPSYDDNWNKIGESKQIQILTAIYKYINTNKDCKLSLSRTAINNYYLSYLRITDNINMEEKISLQMIFNSHSSFN